MTGYRTEHDVVGEQAIPDEALWGIHTARAAENFPITGTPLSAHRDLVRALGSVKQAAVRANQDLGLVDATRASVIDAACEEVRDGSLDAHFVVDVVQGGAGTSTNMNVNEVVANRALQLLGHEPGRYDVLDPLDQVNRSQSTNDVYPPPSRSRSSTR